MYIHVYIISYYQVSSCKNFAKIHYRYTEDGHNKGTPEFTPPPPTRLQWDLNSNCITAIEESHQVMLYKLKISL